MKVKIAEGSTVEVAAIPARVRGPFHPCLGTPRTGMRLALKVAKTTYKGTNEDFSRVIACGRKRAS